MVTVSLTNCRDVQLKELRNWQGVELTVFCLFEVLC